MPQKLSLLLTGTVMAMAVAGRPIEQTDALALAAALLPSLSAEAAIEPRVETVETSLVAPEITPPSDQQHVEKGIMWGGISACSVM